MKTFLAVMALVAGFTAHAADESTTKAKKEEIMKEQRQNAPVQEDIDNEITNAKMRADSGSKSKHSLSFSAGYNGGSINKAFGNYRPNIAANSTTPAKTALNGDLSYRYRLSSTDSLSAGVGLSWVTPTFNGQKVEASTPSISYGKSFKAAGLQNSIGLTAAKTTTSEIIESQKSNGGLSFDQVSLAEIGRSGWQLGLATTFGYDNYFASVRDQNEYTVGVFPFVEYAFNDKYNFRTVYRGNTYISQRENNAAFAQEEPTQSLGIGIAATRDIFLYPNIQWVWRDVTAEKTNVALSASMNFF